jgi:hypothetical protein
MNYQHVFKWNSLTSLCYLIPIWLSCPPARALTFTDWTSPTAGNLDGTTVTLTNFNTPLEATLPLSGPDYSPPSPNAFDEVIIYGQSSTWTATFAAPITDPRIYAFGWQNGSYEFDQAFSIQSGFTGASIIGNTLDLSSATSSNGIIILPGSVSDISVLNASGGSGLIFLTFAVPFEVDASLGLGVLAGFLGVVVYRKRRNTRDKITSALQNA